MVETVRARLACERRERFPRIVRALIRVVLEKAFFETKCFAKLCASDFTKLGAVVKDFVIAHDANRAPYGERGFFGFVHPARAFRAFRAR